jgi:hypothetical protein
MLALGHSASTFAPNQRDEFKLAVSKSGPRQMLKESRMAEIFSHQFFRYGETRSQGIGSSSTTLAAIEDLLAETVANLSASESNDLDETGSMNQELKATLMPDRPKNRMPVRPASVPKLTAVKLLQALESVMYVETFAFRVDYFSLQTRCFRLLRTIKSEMQSTFVKYYHPMFIEKESELPMLAGYIFRVVSGGEKEYEMIPKELRSYENGSKILLEVGELLDKMIAKEGEVEIAKVKLASHVFKRFELIFEEVSV